MSSRTPLIQAPSLSDPCWKDLVHAYGPASDIPKYLEEVLMDPSKPSVWNQSPWYYLWSSLCHQGTIYSASIAAVPHLIRAAHEALEVGNLCTWDCLGLPVAIEQARPANPSVYADKTYFEAFRTINELLHKLKEKQLSHPLKQACRDARKLLKELKMAEPTQASTLPSDDLFG